MEYNITYRQKDKGWQYIISYKDEQGKWKQRSKQGFKTKAIAKIAADKRLDDMKKDFKVSLSKDYEGITFEEFKEIYKEHKKLYVEPGTFRNIGFALNKFSELDDMELKDVRPIHIQSCVDSMVKEGLTVGSIDIYLTIAKTLFNAAVDQFNIISSNPVKNIIVPRSKIDDKIKVLSKKEYWDLISKLGNQRTRVVSLLAGTCGLRIGEIMGLTWDRINFKESTLVIDRQWKRYNDSRHRRNDFGSVKQRNSNRIVPIPPKTLSALIKYKKSNPTDLDNRVILLKSSTNMTRILKKDYNKAGYDITCHTLRHTYATTLIANGLDFKSVAELMGHDVEQTIKTYSHFTDEMMDRATVLVNDIFK